MCQHVASPPFPSHLPLFDAHCHPTDTMASVACIPNMRARALTVMATRSQDQQLVADVAADLPLGGGGPDALVAPKNVVVPAFGWHPWFSYQLYDDTSSASTYDPSSADRDTAKAKHYAAVLAPAPDQAFISSLPPPAPLSLFLSETRSRLTAHPHALVGEVGLDKAFRLPQQWHPDAHAERDASLTPGGREGRLLSPYRVRMPHQRAVLSAQLRLAGEVGRAVSVHGVQAHGVLYDALAACWAGFEREVVSRRQRRMVAPGAEDFSSDEEEKEEEEAENVGGKPFPPRICLHSYSGPAEMLKQYFHPAVPCKVFVSFSSAINMGTENWRDRLDEVIKAVPDDCVLVESDLHTAGEDMDVALEEIYRAVCELKGWSLEEGVEIIAKNYENFIFG